VHNDLRHLSCTTPQVHESLDSLSLFFSFRDVQSQMSLENPNELSLEYTRLMMGFLLFLPKVEHIGMVGLGGGSIAKYCYHQLPWTNIRVVEINPYVIDLSSKFHVPENNDRFEVICDDAAHYMKGACQQFDVLLLDGFDVEGMPQQLCTMDYYVNCHKALTDQGILVVNLHRCDPMFDIYMDRLRLVFKDAVIQVNDSSASNAIVYCFKSSPMQSVSARGLRNLSAVDDTEWNVLLPSLACVYFAFRAKLLKPSYQRICR